jgi:hypothetical protein
MQQRIFGSSLFVGVFVWGLHCPSGLLGVYRLVCADWIQFQNRTKEMLSKISKWIRYGLYKRNGKGVVNIAKL